MSFALTPDAPPARRALDKYRTPEWVTAALLEYFPEVRGSVLIDPCAGDLRMAQHLERAERVGFVITNDLDPLESAQTHEDASSASFWGSSRIAAAVQWAHQRKDDAWVVTNPPFSGASKIVYEALQAVPNVAMLLRVTWLEPTKDRIWLGRMSPTAMLVLPRFSFTGAGSDSSCCCWMLWGNVAPGIKVCTKTPGQLALFGGTDD